ncbi:hypothetical protein QFC22_003470 [Naganishia vaughanmartiniae]|uniref:Uncharacterized protein n=1 Tax=Naganishia vaughanmartiniae TaxID=1424756 RepID=A0ACC2X8P9_9TREE|nr:hypothetical protein QFC22_003470 [Naganishia vaughanmartiniae]
MGSSAMSSGTGTTTLGINGTSTLTGALPTGTGNGTNNGTKNGTESAAMGMGVHAAQYVLPGVAAVGAIVYSGFLGL